MDGRRTAGDRAGSCSTSTAPSSTSRSRATGRPVVLVHGLGLTGALWNRVADALERGTRSSASTSAAPAVARARARRAHARPLGRRPRRRARRGSSSSGPTIVGHSLGASDRAEARARAAGAAVARSVLIGDGGRPLEPRRRACRRPRSGSRAMGLEAGWTSSGRRTRPSRSPRSRATRRCSTSTAACCSRTTPRTTSASAGDRGRRAAVRAGCGEVGAARRSSLVGGLDNRTLPEHGRELAERAAERARSSSCRKRGTRSRSRRRRRRPTRSRAFLARGRRGRGGGTRRRVGVLRADTTPRNSTRGAVRPPRRPLGRRRRRPARR